MSSCFRLVLNILVAFLVLNTITAFAQKKTDDVISVQIIGEHGVSRTTSDIMEKDRELQGVARPIRFQPEHEMERDGLPQNPLSPQVSQWPPKSSKEENSSQQQGVLAPQTLSTTFTGATLADAGAFPPDVMGTVGPTQFIVAINGRIRSFNKTTGVADGVLNADMDVFFSSVMTPPTSSNFTSDPRIRYDRLTGRWYVIIIDVPSNGNVPNRILVAVSDGGTISPSSVWTYFYFSADASLFADYPTLGVDKNALYIGCNMFTTGAAGTFSNTKAFVVRKSSILGAGPIVVTAFSNLIAGTGTGPWTPQGVDNFDTTATEGYFIGVDNATFGTLILRRISTPEGTPSISSNISLTVPATAFPSTVPHLGNTGGTNGKLDALDDRLFMAMIRNGHLWTAHNVQVSNTGSSSGTMTRDGSRWYDVTNLSSAPILVQSGTVYDATAPNDANQRNYWIPSIMASGQGHVALGFSVAGTSERVNAGTVGRLADDALGSIQTPALYTSTSSAYNPSSDPGGSSGRRWGDYSYTSLDPEDDMTMWTIQEFCNATDSWGCRVVKLLAPLPATPSGTSPAAVSTGTTVNVTLTGTSISGSGFYDPGSAFSKRISVAVNGGGVTVNSITYTNPTTLTLNLTIAGGATTGARTVTVTNPDGQSVTSSSSIITVNNGNCPAITLSPSTLPNGAAGSSYSQTITASGGQAAYTYSVTTGTLPSGLSLSGAGFLSGTPSFGGVSSFTITAIDVNGCSGSQAYTLTVTGCPQITLSPTTLSNGTEGTSYNQTITANGGTAPYIFAVTTGTLPAGLSLTSGGVLSGTPTSPGTSNFTVTATDASGNSCTGSEAYSLTIDALVVNYIALHSLGVAYTQNFDALASTGTSSVVPLGWTFNESGANANITYTAGTGSSNSGNTYSFGSLSSSERAFGGLQSGSLNPTIGAVFGNNTGTTVTSLTISYVGEQWRLGATGRTDNLDFQMSMDATSLTTGTWTDYNSLDFTGPVTAGTVGALDGNNSANRTTISATITGLNIANSFQFWIRWLDSNVNGADDGEAVDDFSLTPNGTDATSPSGTGAANPVTVVIGNTTLLTVHVVPGTNPASTGLTVTADLTDINGSASQQLYDDGTHGDVTAGDNVYSFRATVPIGTPSASNILPVNIADAQLRTGTTTIAVDVIPCTSLTLTPASLPSGTAGTAYSQSVQANGGTSPYAYTTSSGALPTGLTLSAGGTLSGTPTASGNFSFTISATDTFGCVGSQAYTVNIQCPTITLLPSTLPDGLVGTVYNQSVSASGSSSSYTYTLTSGTLPGGITLGSDGIVSGTINASGVFNFTITATDTFGCTGNRAYTISVNGVCPALTILPASFMDGTVGIAYNETLFTYDGTPPYLYSLSAGSLPDGISLSSNGIISGTTLVVDSVQSTMTITDANGCEGSRQYTLKIVQHPPVSVFVSVNNQWNVLSNPVIVPNDSIHYVYPPAIGDAFFFQQGIGYQPEQTLQPGIGCWLRIEPAQVVKITGIPIFAESVDVADGWNLFGPITSKIAVSSLVEEGTTIVSHFFGYDGSYIGVDTLEPGKGFWVKCSGAGKIRMTSPEIPTASLSIKTPVINEPKDCDKLIFSDAGGCRQVLYLGTMIDPQLNPENFALPPLPPDGAFDIRFTENRTLETIDLRESSHSFSVMMQASSYPITVRLERGADVSQRITLREPNGDLVATAQQLNSREGIRISNKNMSKLIVKVQDIRTLPDQVIVSDCYPNPFNPSTRIRFALPKESFVTLKVYNLLGQEIQTLIEAKYFDAGDQEVGFDTGSLSAGVYLYRLEVTPQSGAALPSSMIIKKMVLVK